MLEIFLEYSILVPNCAPMIIDTNTRPEITMNWMIGSSICIGNSTVMKNCAIVRSETKIPHMKPIHSAAIVFDIIS